MTGKVIQGSFLTGQPRWTSAVQPKIAPSSFQVMKVVPPPSTFAGPRTGAPQAIAARLPGPRSTAVASHPPGTVQPGGLQRHGAGGAFAVEAGPLGLVNGGGKPLPEAARGKMEAALGADFSKVRVHVGPQAERLGAIAFTVGSDIYFAPGRYQPDTIQGQQLLGHELAHVVQQRAGRVRNPLGSGFAVVQDRALEAEADRLGQRAASHRVTAQAKLAASPPRRAVPAGKCSCSVQPKTRAGSGRVIQRVDDPCFVPDWASPPYAALLKWEQDNIDVGPGKQFNQAHKDKIYALNRQTHNPGDGIKITVTQSDQVVKSDGDASLLITKRGVTFAIANVDHVVELAKGGCNSCLNAQVLAESANVGATYTGGKWIYVPKEDKLYTNNPSNRRKYDLTQYS